MENVKLEVGDLVRLKSGGPTMTAERLFPVSPPFWFDDRDVPRKRSFMIAALQMV